MEIEKSPNGFSFRLLTDSWYGARHSGYLFRERVLEFPKNWELHFVLPDRFDEMRPLEAAEITESMRTPIGTEPLRKLAESRSDAVIIVDDLSRPTPTHAVIPFVLKELKAGGISEEKTTIIIGVGTHRPITRVEQKRKLGREIVDRVQVVNHNCFTRRLKTYKRPESGPDFRINRIVADADLKISISGILTHGGAGFGGGAKAILPSVSAYKSIRYNHDTFAWEGYGIVYPEQIESAGIRKDMEICAREVGLDYSLNLVYSPRKEVIGVFGGDFVTAHRAGCELARSLFLTTPPTDPFDLVITCGYPMDTDIGQSMRGTWPEKHGRQSVLIAGARDGWAYHGDGGKSYRLYRQMRKDHNPADEYRYRGAMDITEGETRAYFSPTLAEDAFYQRKSERRFFQEWPDVVHAFNGTPQKKTVGVFPFASMQIEGETASDAAPLTEG